MVDDRVLMRQIAGGDMAAFRELVVRHQQSAWQIAYRYLGNRHDAEEIAQEALLKILDNAARYKPSAKFSTYLYRVIANLCFDHSRKKQPLYVDDLPVRTSDDLPPLEELSAVEREQAVQAALDLLSERQRMAVVLRYYQDLSLKEIAVAMGATAKAIERLLAAGRQALSRHLGDFSDM
jgi:RNA polymerase sigma-70 factor (ECF subfamily)